MFALFFLVLFPLRFLKPDFFGKMQVGLIMSIMSVIRTPGALTVSWTDWRTLSSSLVQWQCDISGRQGWVKKCASSSIIIRSRAILNEKRNLLTISVVHITVSGDQSPLRWTSGHHNRTTVGCAITQSIYPLGECAINRSPLRTTFF